jgi:hypothetical protein
VKRGLWLLPTIPLTALLAGCGGGGTAPFTVSGTFGNQVNAIISQSPVTLNLNGSTPAAGAAGGGGPGATAAADQGGPPQPTATQAPGAPDGTAAPKGGSTSGSAAAATHSAPSDVITTVRVPPVTSTTTVAKPTTKAPIASCSASPGHVCVP